MVVLRRATVRMEEQMLRKEQNELVTQTGPGTPMGQLFRSYWTPALLTEELPENDSPPVRVKLLSERLVAFRDSQGLALAERSVPRYTSYPTAPHFCAAVGPRTYAAWLA